MRYHLPNAKEILRPSNSDEGFFGGEGLEADLILAAQDGRISGILNGCEYPPEQDNENCDSPLLLQCEKELLSWIAAKTTVESAHLISLHNLTRWLLSKSTHQPFIVTSVGRVTDQKALILRQEMENGQSALEQLLEILGDDRILLMLGNGDRTLEQFLTQVAARNKNFIFLKGYSESLAQSMYERGDLFLMPSSFEPCGISQMLAMRAGQPCLVHGVGGLRDTVNDHENGFVFKGESLREQASNMLQSCKTILELNTTHPERWQKISTQATRERFLWSDVAKEYIGSLYLG